jgi:plasmid stabilization system protein ParE
MNSGDWPTLGATSALIALALVIEHYLVRPFHLPEQWLYALGLVTDMGGLLVWAACRSVTITWPVATVMLLAGCLAGSLDAALHFLEQAEARKRWAELETANAELVAQLRLLRSKPVNSRYLRRLREMVETAAFTAAALRRERELIQQVETQASDLLVQVKEIVGGERGEPDA